MTSVGSIHALVVADGEAPTRDALESAWSGWDSDVALVVAADGGARLAAALGLRIDVVVGDADSLGEAELERYAAAGAGVSRARGDKDETDTELAVLEAVRSGATRVTLLGALGGPRVDHELANVLLLGREGLEGVDLAIVDPRARISLLDARPGPVRRPLPGAVGATVSLLAFGGEAAVGVTIGGFRYPLHGERLSPGVPRGVSNVRVAADAWLRLESGRLLVVEVPVTLGR